MGKDLSWQSFSFHNGKTCGDDKQCSKSNVKEKNTKHDLSKHERLKNVDVRSGVMDERASSADRSHPPRALWRYRETEKSVDN